MMQFGLIGIGAGAAAALLFASVSSGSFLSIILFYLAPLPVMIAGLGWSHWAALLAAITATLAVAVLLGGVATVAFLAAIAVPAWWLSYLAMLGRPVPAAAEAASGAGLVEWYPSGRLVLWAAALGMLLVLAAIPNFGLDAASFRSGLADALSQMFHADPGNGQPIKIAGISDSKRLVEFLVAVVPAAAAVAATVTNLINLWLAGRVVKFSGRLARPWPDLSAMTFPPLAAAVLAVALAASFIGGMAGILAGAVTAALVMAYGVLGFAVLHAITRGQASRPFLLGGIYASVLVFGWPLLLLALLAFVDTIFHVRARIARRRATPV
jgi:hypothetical protein